MGYICDQDKSFKFNYNSPIPFISYKKHHEPFNCELRTYNKFFEYMRVFRVRFVKRDHLKFDGIPSIKKTFLTLCKYLSVHGFWHGFGWHVSSYVRLPIPSENISEYKFNKACSIKHGIFIKQYKITNKQQCPPPPLPPHKKKIIIIQLLLNWYLILLFQYLLRTREQSACIFQCILNMAWEVVSWHLLKDYTRTRS